METKQVKYSSLPDFWGGLGWGLVFTSARRGKIRASRVRGGFDCSRHPPAPFQILEGGAVFNMEFSAKNRRKTPFAM